MTHTPATPLKRIELVNDGCAEQTVFYSGLRVGGWVPETGMFREWGKGKASMYFSDKRALTIFLIARFGALEQLARA
jgi:hypothetical protein